MNRTTAKAAAIAAALILPNAAAAGVLYDGYHTAGAGVETFTTSPLNEAGQYFNIPQTASGLAASGNDLFVSYGSTLAHYDSAGALQNSVNTGPGFTPGQLATDGNLLFVGFLTAGMATGVDILDAADFGEKGLAFYLPGELTGLAYGDGNLFVSYSHHLARYDLAGNLLQDVYTGSDFDPASLAFGDGKLFVAYSRPATGASGVDFVDGSTFNDLGTYFTPPSLPVGLAFGDGQLFASFEHGLGTWDMTGTQTQAVNTGVAYFSGQIAYAEPGRGFAGVPEPATWAVMILGFGLAGANLRRRATVTA